MGGEGRNNTVSPATTPAKRHAGRVNSGLIFVHPEALPPRALATGPSPLATSIGTSSEKFPLHPFPPPYEAALRQRVSWLWLLVLALWLPGTLHCRLRPPGWCRRRIWSAVRERASMAKYRTPDSSHEPLRALFRRGTPLGSLQADPAHDLLPAPEHPPDLFWIISPPQNRSAPPIPGP